VDTWRRWIAAGLKQMLVERQQRASRVSDRVNQKPHEAGHLDRRREADIPAESLLPPRHRLLVGEWREVEPQKNLESINYIEAASPHDPESPAQLAYATE
jgi:hypothetical protein